MMDKTDTINILDVDEGLVAMFLKMSPEERLKENDNAVRAVLEMRNTFQQKKDSGSGPKRNY